MAALNDGMTWAQAPDYVQKAFERGAADKHLFSSGTELFKFTAFDLYPADRSGGRAVGKPISPWWCTVEPILGPGDLGLDGLIAAAAAAGISPLDYVRENLAVMYGWNSLGSGVPGLARVQKIRLTKPVYGFFGGTKPQRNDRFPTLTNPVKGVPGWLRGGMVQIWIPNLTAEYFVGTGYHLLG